jgi:NAD+ synthase
MITDKIGLIREAKMQIRAFAGTAVIGLSGGADSTLVAILCKLALGAENVHAVHMPCSELDNETFNATSRRIAHHLDIMDIDFPIYHICNAFVTSMNFERTSMDDKLMGNIKARVRMTALYAVAESLTLDGKPTVRVIGTDNLSENALGYFTKYGDGGVDFNPIGALYKSEVYQLLDFFKELGIIEEEHINRVPSAGLWTGQTDEGELGFTYDEIEVSLRKNMADMMYEKDRDACDQFVYETVKKTAHKRVGPPEIKELRAYCDEDQHDNK